MLSSYLPVLFFCILGLIIGGAFVFLNSVLGPRRPSTVKSEPYECGLPSEISRTFRFGASFYMTAMQFIIFDIEVIFMYPVATILNVADSIFVLVHMLLFMVLLAAGLGYAWAKGAFDWR
ncbi:MAG: NADH-quinone oxidoreductase subunit A [Solirubrobacterales bacterium]